MKSTTADILRRIDQALLDIDRQAIAEAVERLAGVPGGFWVCRHELAPWRAYESRQLDQVAYHVADVYDADDLHYYCGPSDHRRRYCWSCDGLHGLANWDNLAGLCPTCHAEIVP